MLPEIDERLRRWADYIHQYIGVCIRRGDAQIRRSGRGHIMAPDNFIIAAERCNQMREVRKWRTYDHRIIDAAAAVLVGIVEGQALNRLPIPMAAKRFHVKSPLLRRAVADITAAWEVVTGIRKTRYQEERTFQPVHKTTDIGVTVVQGEPDPEAEEMERALTEMRKDPKYAQIFRCLLSRYYYRDSQRDGAELMGMHRTEYLSAIDQGHVWLDQWLSFNSIPEEKTI